jgi:hypothetical protein
MSTEEIIKRLKVHLKGFTIEELDQITEEIASHIECVEQDEALGMDVAERRKRLISELGSVEKMGQRFNRVYKSVKIIDYLLIIILILILCLQALSFETLEGKMEFLLFIMLVCGVWTVVTSLLIARDLEKRGVSINYLLLRLMILKYLHQYHKITKEETGRVGPLFYHYIVPINGALVLAVTWAVLTLFG